MPEGDPDLDRCYRILELSPGASVNEIRRAYYDLARVWHPDRFASHPHLQRRGEERLKEINAAYRALLRASSAGFTSHDGGSGCESTVYQADRTNHRRRREQSWRASFDDVVRNIHSRFPKSRSYAVANVFWLPAATTIFSVFLSLGLLYIMTVMTSAVSRAMWPLRIDNVRLLQPLRDQPELLRPSRALRGINDITEGAAALTAWAVRQFDALSRRSAARSYEHSVAMGSDSSPPLTSRAKRRRATGAGGNRTLTGPAITFRNGAELIESIGRSGAGIIRIQNATELDAVVGLSAVARPGVPLRLVYVEMHAQAELAGLAPGRYILTAVFGREWDSHRRAFRSNQQAANSRTLDFLQIQDAHGIEASEYEIILQLTEAPDHR